MIDQQKFSFVPPATYKVARWFSPLNYQLLLVENSTSQNAGAFTLELPVPSSSSAIESIGYHDVFSIAALFLAVILIISLVFFFFRRQLQTRQPEKQAKKQLVLESPPSTTEEKAMMKAETPESALETTTLVVVEPHLLAEELQKLSTASFSLETTTPVAVEPHPSAQKPAKLSTTSSDKPQDKHFPNVKSGLMTLEQAVDQRVARISQSHHLVRKHALGAMAIGLIPLPMINITAIMAVQINLLYRLAQRYEVTFSHQIAKSLVAFLLSGTLIGIQFKPLAKLVRIVPIIGPASGIISMSLLGGATTYAVGKVFIQHFESGGIFLDADPQKMRRHFQQVYEEGKHFASSQ